MLGCASHIPLLAEDASRKYEVWTGCSTARVDCDQPTHRCIVRKQIVYFDVGKQCSIKFQNKNCLQWTGWFTLLRAEGVDLRTPYWDTRGNALQLFVQMSVRYHESRSAAWALFTVDWWVHIVKCKKCSIMISVVEQDCLLWTGKFTLSRANKVDLRTPHWDFVVLSLLLEISLFSSFAFKRRTRILSCWACCLKSVYSVH